MAAAVALEPWDQGDQKNGKKIAQILEKSSQNSCQKMSSELILKVQNMYMKSFVPENS